MKFKFNFRKAAELIFGVAAMLLAALLSFSAAAATVSYSQSYTTGWNLAGNSLSTAIDVKATFGPQTSITTIWKWDAVNAKWAFYSPALDTAGTLTNYASTKGYNVLTTINQGEGYWVNASAQISLAQASGMGFSLAASNLVAGWNLVATGDDVAPAVFTTTVGNVTTQWAWDNATSAWYFYAPSMAANNTLAGYITGKNYKDFGALTLGKGLGFWVNYAGAGGSTAPSAPTAPTATVASATQINLSWAAVTGATGYNVYRSTAANVAISAGNKITATPVTTTSYNNTGLTASTLYYYKITAVNSSESAGSAEATATTSAVAQGGSCATIASCRAGGTIFSEPTAVTATAASATQINLSWTAVTGATGYNVYRSAAPNVTVSSLNKITATPVTATSYNDTSYMTASTVYYYKVTTVIGVGESSQGSSVVSATPSAPAGAPAAPTNIVATAGAGKITFSSWTAVTGALSYNLYYSTTSPVTKASATVGGIPKPWVLNGATSGAAYYYALTAVNAAGESDLSIQGTVTPTGAVAIPADPISASVTPSVNQLTFAWPSAPAATSYKLYYGISSSNLTAVPAVTSPYVLTGLLGTTSYYYKITAVNSAGESVGTAGYAQTTSAPTGGGIAVTGLMGGAKQGNALALANTVSTYAGGGAGAATAIGTAASFYFPKGVTTDGANLYVVENGNATIRKVVIATGEASIFFKGGQGLTVGANGVTTCCSGMWDITTDGTNLYIVDKSAYTVSQVNLATKVWTFLGSYYGALGGSTDGTGTAARFFNPTGVTTDGTNLYVTDAVNRKVRQIVIATGVVTTLAGGGPNVLDANQNLAPVDGTGANASFTTYIAGITTDGTYLYVADYTYIRKITIATGEVTTISLGNHLARGVTTDGVNLYVGDQNGNGILKVVIATGAVTNMAGFTGSGSINGAGASARFSDIFGLTTDGTSLYIIDAGLIRQIQ